MKTGTIGENFVALWGSQAGVTANAVQRDEFGWDFCFQFRREPNVATAGPLDLVAPEVTTFLQVKTSASGAMREDVTLANWQRMVKDPYPWFFVRVSLDSAGEPERVHLIHVGQEWIERVLKRLRELSDDRPNLNDVTMALTWTDEEAVAQPFGTNLRDAILREVGNLGAYIAKKADVIQRAGFSDFPYEATITAPTRTPEDYERLVDFAIGLTKSLPISSLVVKNVRFGIPQTIKEHRDVLDGSMSFGADGPPSVGKTQLVFTDKARATSITHDFSTYIPTMMFGELPPEHFKARFVSKAVSVLVKPAASAMSISWHFSHDDGIPLSELASAIELMSLCGSATRGLEIAYNASGKVIPVGYQPNAITLSPDALRLVDVVRHATVLAKHLSLESSIPVLPADLDDHRSQLMSMRSMFDKSLGPVEISIVVESVDASVAGKRTAIVLPMTTRLGDCVVMVLVAYFGPAVWDAERSRLSVNAGDTRLLRKWVIPIKEWRGTRSHAAEINSLIDALTKTEEFELVTGPDNLWEEPESAECATEGGA
jgi:hypothetical protein